MNVKKLILPLLLFLYLHGFSVAEKSLTYHAEGKGGAVAAEDPAAVEAGIEVLKNGGNAADAAVSVMLTASVVDYGMFSIGAEVPFIIFDKGSGKVKTLSGLGSAPLDKESMLFYYKDGIPGGGGIRAVPVPGAVHLFFTALIEYGTMTFAEVSRPVLRILDAGGQNWYDELAQTLRKLIDRESSAAGNRKDKLRAARDRFYKGDIANQLVDYYKEQGGFLRLRDLQEHRTLIVLKPLFIC